jgi:hypothetical protein
VLQKTTKTAVQFTTLDNDKREKLKMSTKFNREAYTKVFNDLDKLRDYCRFEGKVFDEKALYKKDHPTWIAYGKWQNYIRAKARNGGRNFQPRRN